MSPNVGTGDTAPDCPVAESVVVTAAQPSR
jgi:hypothetical protein